MDLLHVFFIFLFGFHFRKIDRRVMHYFVFTKELMLGIMVHPWSDLVKTHGSCLRCLCLKCAFQKHYIYCFRAWYLVIILIWLPVSFSLLGDKISSIDLCFCVCDILLPCSLFERKWNSILTNYYLVDLIVYSRLLKCD